MLRTGTQSHALPREQFGPAESVYYYFRQWEEAGVFGAVWAAALAAYDGQSEWTGPGRAWMAV